MRGVDQTNAPTFVDVLNPSVEDVAPGEHAIAQGHRLCRQHDLGVRIVEPAVDADRAAIIDIARELLARREQDQPAILLCQCVRHRIGRGGVVHVEQHRGCILANAVRLCPPVAGADAIADKIIRPPLVRAGGDDHGVGLDGQHVIRGCGLAKLDFHACALRLPLHPSEQRLVFCPCRAGSPPIEACRRAAATRRTELRHDRARPRCAPLAGRQGLLRRWRRGGVPSRVRDATPNSPWRPSCGLSGSASGRPT